MIGPESRQLIERHIKFLAAMKTGKGAIFERRRTIERFAGLLAVPLVEATPEHLDAWQAEQTARLKLATVQTYTRQIRHFYAWAHEHDEIGHNPAGHLRSSVLSPVPKIREADATVIARHLDWLRRLGSRQATMRLRTENLQRLAILLPVPLLEITPEHLDAWQSQLRVSVSSLHTYTCHVRAFCRWAYDSGLIDRDPAERLPVPKVRARTPRPMPESDVARALQSAPEPIRTWLALAGWCGLRAGEIARIRREDLDFDPDSGGTTLHVDGKGGKARAVPVPRRVVEMLQPYVTGRGQIFRRETTGLPVAPHDVTQRTGRFLRSIGLDYTIHKLRHRFATQLARQTKDLRLVQELLGHGSLATTQLYVGWTLEQGAAAVETLADSLPSIPDEPEGQVA